MAKSNKNSPWSRQAAKWKSTWVARKAISDFTGGLISSGHMANMDALHQGPRGAIRVGRDVAYPIDDLIFWLDSKTTPVAGVPDEGQVGLIVRIY